MGITDSTGHTVPDPSETSYYDPPEDMDSITLDPVESDCGTVPGVMAYMDEHGNLYICQENVGELLVDRERVAEFSSWVESLVSAG